MIMMREEFKKKLHDDPKYKAVLKKVPEDVRKQVEKTGDAFIEFLADGLTKLRESLNDPEIKAELQRLLEKKDG